MSVPELPHLYETEQIGERRFSTLVLVGPIRVKPIRTTAGVGIDKCGLEVVFAEKPIECAHGARTPFGASVRAPRCDACRNRRCSLDGLLIERIRFLVDFAEAHAPDRSETARLRGLNLHEPAQGFDARVNVVRCGGCEPRLDQSLRQARIVVGEDILEPAPIIGATLGKQCQHPVGQKPAHTVSGEISRT